MNKRDRPGRLILATLIVFLGIIALCRLLIPIFARLSQADASKRLTAEVTAIITEADQSAEKATDSYSQSVALSALADAQHLAGKAAAQRTFQQAGQLASHIPDNTDQADAFVTLAHAQFDADDMAGARRSLVEAVTAAGKISSTAPPGWQSRRDFELQKVGEEQARFGELTDAQKTADLINDPRTKSLLTSEIAEGQIKAGDLGAAVQAMTDANNHDKALILSEVAEAQIKAGQVAQAHQTIVDALQAAAMITGSDAHTTAWAAVASAQALSGDEAGALASAAKSGDSHIRSQALVEVIEGQLRRNDLAGAIRTVQTITDSSSACRAMQEIAEAQYQSGNTQAAHQTADQAQRLASHVTDPSDQCFAFCAIADVQIGAKDFAGARRTLKAATTAVNAIADQDVAALQRVLIATAQVKANDSTGARANIDQCASDSTRVQMLQQIAALQIRAGQQGSARDTLADASKTMAAILSRFQTSDIDDLQIYSRTVALQEQVRDFVGALGTLNQLRQVTNKVPDPADRSVALSDIIIGWYAPKDTQG